MSWEELLEQYSVIWKYPERGFHAAYSLNNCHSDFYFNSDYLMSQPKLLREACTALAKSLTPNYAVPEWLITYPPYGMNVGFCLAENLGCRLAYIRSLESPELNFDIASTASVMFCADDLYTGGSYEKVRLALAGAGVNLMTPLMVLANFSGDSKFRGHDVVSLIKKTINLWEEDECPLCKAGSTALPARKNWTKLLESGET
ncbi:MAG TPA: hypothetical protein V6C86_01745 [Oculatellaceae cyanobacterium]